jgi:AcrR family transcriptional regulator
MQTTVRYASRVAPRSSVAGAARTRVEIVDAAMGQASLEGLDAITIGRLADRLGMSKAGVIGPFGSKEELQLAALEAANAVFRREVWEPAASAGPGLDRLEAVMESWLSFLSSDIFPGGCFITQAAADFDGRDGPVRAAIEETSRLWEKVLCREARTAVENGELPGDTDPRQVAFELGAIAQGVNQARQLRREKDAAVRGRRAMRRTLGLPGDRP